MDPAKVARRIYRNEPAFRVLGSEGGWGRYWLAFVAQDVVYLIERDRGHTSIQVGRTGDVAPDVHDLDYRGAMRDYTEISKQNEHIPALSNERLDRVLRTLKARALDIRAAVFAT